MRLIDLQNKLNNIVEKLKISSFHLDDINEVEIVAFQPPFGYDSGFGDIDIKDVVYDKMNNQIKIEIQ